MTHNKLDNSFGPAGTSAGIFLFMAGIGITFFYSPLGIIIMVIGAFVGFSNSSTLIDSDQKRIKFTNNLFGLVPTGKWIPIKKEMALSIKRSNRSWRAYSRSNGTLDTSEYDYRIMLLDKNGKEIMSIKKYSTLKTAKADLGPLSQQLGLSAV